MTDQSEAWPDQTEIQIYPTPDDDEQALLLIVIDPAFVHAESWGLRLEGCWTIGRLDGTGTGEDGVSGAFVVGTELYPWHRVAQVNTRFFAVADSDYRRSSSDDMSLPDLAEWASSRGVDLARVTQYYERFVKWNRH